MKQSIATPPLSPERLDIGMRSRFKQSSFLEPQSEAEYLMPSAWLGGFFFQTNIEPTPWVKVDLGRPRTVGEIVIWNREDRGAIVSDRAVPLRIEVSDDDASWREVARVSEPYGGRLSGEPHTLCFPDGATFRFIRLVLEKQTHFHLDYIEIIQFLPQLSFGRFVRLSVGQDDVISCEYIHYAINGLYSGYSTALQDIMTLSRAGIAVRKIDLSASFSHFKDGHNVDAHQLFFKEINTLFLSECQLTDFNCADIHRHYCNLPLGKLRHVAEIAFRPSVTVESRSAALIKSAGLNLSKTIAVVYRGTDKSAEATLAPITDYINLVEQLVEKHPNHLVLIQTDQEQARHAFVGAFGDRCRYFESLPVTPGSTVMHMQLAKVSKLTKQRFSEDLMAAVLAIARSHIIVTHTGNVGAWIAIYRGSTENLYQFDIDGLLVHPE